MGEVHPSAKGRGGLVTENPQVTETVKLWRAAGELL